MGGDQWGLRQRGGRQQGGRRTGYGPATGAGARSGAVALRATADPIQRADDHTVAAEADLTRDFACLVSVCHLAPGDERRLRLVAGVTGVIESDGAADVHMIVGAPDARSATRVCVESISDRLPQSVVTVYEIVDYDHALVAFLEQHGEHPDDVSPVATFDDAEAVAHILDQE